MTFSPRTWTRIALAGGVLGAGLLALGLTGYALGWNVIGGTRHGSNLVPFLLFSGLTLLILAGGTLIARATKSLPSCPPILAILALAGACGAFVLLYVKHVAPLVLLRADIAMGSESQFVDQLIRYRAGQPQYTPAEDANSTAYGPGAPIVTYWIASLAGKPASIRVYRLIQQFYILIAVGFCAAASLSLLRFLRPQDENVRWWPLFWLPFLYLMATNPFTNVYTHVLYSDGLGLAANSIAIWLLIEHLTTQNGRFLIPMAILPALGFLAKQKEALWLALYVIYFLLAGRVPLRRVIALAVGGGALLMLAAGLCYALWGDAFWFWNFEVLSRLHISLKEVLDQAGEGSLYILPGIIGGLLLLRGEWLGTLMPAWICWLVHMMAAIYTSGIAFRPAHFGPATMFGMVWFLVGLATLWPEGAAEQTPERRANAWLKSAGVTISIVLFMLAGGLLRPGSSVPPGMDRYLEAIEREFVGLPRDKVLVDTGSWVYLSQDVVMRDRESPLGTLWGTGASDYQATLDRFRGQHYARILARKDMFFYRDDRLRTALLDGYHEVRTIPGTGVPRAGWLYRFLLSDVAVLEPKPPSAVTEPAKP